MKKKRSIIAVILANMFLICCLSGMNTFATETEEDSSDDPVSAESVIAPGEDEPLRDNPATIPGQWITINGKRRYLHNDGTFYTNRWEYIDGYWYYFDADGFAKTGWLNYNNKWYFLKPPTGQMAIGWYMIQGKWYYFESNGAMVTGWLHINDNWYYLDTDGAMVTQWKKIGDYWYYFNTNGTMVTGWREISNNVGSYWYFFKPSGQMVTGWHEVLGYTYFFNNNGQLQNTTRRAMVLVDDFDDRILDLDGWEECLSSLSFKSEYITEITTLAGPSEQSFRDNIRLLMKDAKEGDITYICISCHGDTDGGIHISPTTTISGETLRDILRQYEGKVVLFLDCCYSGMIIHRGETVLPETAFLSAFMDDSRSGELINDKYLVLCASAYDELSWRYYDENNQHLLSAAINYWTLGGGWDIPNWEYTDMEADENLNSIVTLDELYDYSASILINQQALGRHNQQVKVYPSDSNFTIFARN